MSCKGQRQEADGPLEDQRMHQQILSNDTGWIRAGRLNSCLCPVCCVGLPSVWVAPAAGWPNVNRLRGWLSMSELCLATSTVGRLSETKCPQTTSCYGTSSMSSTANLPIGFVKVHLYIYLSIYLSISISISIYIYIWIYIHIYLCMYVCVDIDP